MTEDAKALEDGPAFEPTKRLRGLAAVEDVGIAETVAMSENGKDVSSRGRIYVPADKLNGVCEGFIENATKLPTDIENRGSSFNEVFSPYL